ncbi:hypothetical protein AS850_12380 [Frondihabitans sp. 762G35]|uniref:glycosyltransferase family 39 protein n=1 Tax=Frondihabitans sp. 762G35 TaxID=1446794 RepID=UPI000D1FF228|nr:glycosyltransferase family 39 protein [Frondihabitans sp. 762G35]ARC57872.1 hypothetical protein AS850_12380 [Frondihabitans sp. 762G35]
MTVRRIAPLVGAFATILSMVGSWIPSLWGDEAASVMSAQRSIPSLLTMLTHVDAVHGSYYLGLHAWIDLYGASPFVVRIPPAIAVGVAVAGVVMLVGELATTRLAVIAGLVTSILPRVTYMGEETRAYAFSAAFVVWATWLLVRLLRAERPGRRWWIAYAAVFLLGVYSFLYVGLFVVVHGVVVLTTRRDGRFVRRWAAAIVAVVVLASPLLVLGYLERAQIAFLEQQDNITFQSMTVGLWFGNAWFAALAWLLIVVAVVAAVVRVRRDGWPRREERPSLTFVALLWLLVPAVILVVASLVKASFTSRYMSYSAPAAGILMAIGIETLARAGWRRMLGAVVLVAAAVAPIYVSQRTPYSKNESDWAVISSTVAAHAKPGDAIVFDDDARPSRRPRLALHTYPAGFAGLDDVTLKTPFTRSDTWYDRTYSVETALAQGKFDGHDRVFVVEYVRGGTVDTYGLADLKAAGYAVRATYPTHSSRILELVRSGS